MGAGHSADDGGSHHSSQPDAEANRESRDHVDLEDAAHQSLPGANSSPEVRDVLITKSILLRMNNTPTHHVVGKLSSFSGVKKHAALAYLAQHYEELANGKDIAELDTAIPYPNIMQAYLEKEIMFSRGTQRFFHPLHAIRCKGMEPVHSPANRAWKSEFEQLSPVNKCYYILGENILEMCARLLETHCEVGRQAMCYVGFVDKTVAIDGGMNRWPISPSYHTVRMRPVIDGSHHRVRHADIIALNTSNASEATKCLFALTLKLADDFARLDIAELSGTELRLNFLNYFRGYKGALSSCAKLLMSIEEEDGEPIRLMCFSESNYHFQVQDGNRHLKYCGHSKYAVWAVDFINSALKLDLAPRFPYFDNLHSCIILCHALWKDETSYNLGETIRSIFALLLCDDIPKSDHQEWYMALEDRKDLLESLPKSESAFWSEAHAKLQELFATTSGVAIPLEIRSSTPGGIAHQASWLAGVPSITEEDPLFAILRPGLGWTIDGDLSKSMRTKDANGVRGDLYIGDGKAHYKPRTSAVTKVKECLGRVNSVQVHDFVVSFTPVEISEKSTSAEVIHAALSGVLGVRAGLFILKKMFLGSIDVSEESVSTVTAVCRKKEDGAVVDSFLAQEVFAEMAVVTDGEKIYSVLADSSRCVSIVRNRHGRYEWTPTQLPDIKKLKKGIYRHPALVE